MSHNLLRIARRRRSAALLSVFYLIGCGGGTDGSGGVASSDVAPAALATAAIPVPQNSNINPDAEPGFSPLGVAALRQRPEPLALMMEVVDNHAGNNGESCAELGAEYASCSWLNLHLKDSNGVLDGQGWRIYFHSLRRVLRVDSPHFGIRRVNGDLHYLEPLDDYRGMAEDVATLRLVTEFSFLNQSDVLPRAWLLDANARVHLIQNTDTDARWDQYLLPISGDNRYAYPGEPITLATPATRYESNRRLLDAFAALPPGSTRSRIVPTPQSVTPGNGTLDISNGLTFIGTAWSAESRDALQRRATLLGLNNGGVVVEPTLDPTLGSDRYQLEIQASGIALRGGSESALFYGAQSVLGLVQPGESTLPQLSMVDEPRYRWRGVHIDVARNFRSPAELRSLIDQMAAYKLNRLQLHLADDEGWRLEIPGLPELTDIGARRIFRVDANGDIDERFGLMPQLGSGPDSSSSGSGYYSRAEFIALLQYAAARHVTIVPAIDMPGHARAAVVAMRNHALNQGNINDLQLRIDDPADTSRYMTVQHYSDGLINPCVPGTLDFVARVVDEIALMYIAAGVTPSTFHMGGDEAKNIYLQGGFQDLGTANPVDWKGNADLSQWDEPWSASPACQRFIQIEDSVDSLNDLVPWFLARVSEITHAAGFTTLLAYHDIYADSNGLIDPTRFASHRIAANVWVPIYNNAAARTAALRDAGYVLLQAPPDFMYFDFMQEADPAEPGSHWGSRQLNTTQVFGFSAENLAQNAAVALDQNSRAYSATSAGPAGAEGIQAHLWSETVRTQDQFDHMLYPRLLALAERAWHRPVWEADAVNGTTYTFNDPTVNFQALHGDQAAFFNVLGERELRKLDAAGVAWRIPLPGATTRNGSLQMNASLPGLVLQYSEDGVNFVDWSEGSGTATAVRALSADRTHSSRIDKLP